MSERRPLTRAEIVRRRRAERMDKELETAARRALKPMAKVTSRAPMTPSASTPTPAKSRRFDAALPFPGFRLSKPKFKAPNLRLPHIRFRHTNWRYVSIGLAVALGALLYFAFTLPYFYIPAASVFGNRRLTQEEINAALGVSGESVFFVQPQELQMRLLAAYPELQLAEVRVDLPNRVYVTVVERQPVIFWEQEGEGYTWVDASGVAFRPRGLETGLIHVIALDTPPAGIAEDPFSPTPYVKQELVDAILTLAPLVPQNAALTFDSIHGLGWDDPRGWRAVFGIGAQDMPMKMRVYQALVDSLLSRGVTPALVSVKFVDAPYYRLLYDRSAEENVVDSEQ